MLIHLKLLELIKQHGGQEALAAFLGVSQTTISDALTKRHPISAKLAAKMGFRREIVYVPLSGVEQR